MAFTEDLSVFFNTGDFAVAATFTHAASSPVTVNVIYDAAYADPLGVEGAHPRAHGAIADFTPALAQGDTIVIPVLGTPTTFKIMELRPDSSGVVTLTLQEQ